MKNYLLPALLGCLAVSAPAQVVTTTPAIVQTDSKNIVITFHADEGNRGLASATSSTKVYAHTGVITSESTGSGDWKYAPTWLDNSAKYELTYVSPQTWSLTIPSIESYYGVKAGETVEALMFVFRNATGTMEGKTAQGGDISVPVYPAGFQVVASADTEGSVINGDEAVNFTVNTTSPANITLYVEGDKSNPIARANNSTTLTGSRKFTTVGSYNIIAEATPTAGGAAKTTTLTLVRLAASQQAAYPGGVPVMGTVPSADGTSATFCIAAPGIGSMVLVPSWNGYKVTSDLQMKYQDYQGNRYFWTTVTGLTPGTDYIYYYLADGTKSVGDPYARLVLDPWSDKYIPAEVFPDMPAYPVGKVPEGLPLAVYNSNSDSYFWKIKDFKGADPDKLVIYELLIRDFTGTEGQANGEGTIAGVMDKLDYLQSLGVNAIELLPIMEFNGNNSWGYNTNFYFAPDKAYGTPDDYRALIDECHARGMAVILDIVFNQSDGLHPWYQLYPIADNPFYNATAPHAYSVLNDWKQENPLVEKQWTDALKYWLTAYNVDGFRFDLVKGLGDSNSYGAVYNEATNAWSSVTDAKTNAYNQSRIDRMKRLHAAMKEVKPDAYFINEDLAGAEEENAMATDSELNWANINGASTLFAQGLFSSNCDLRRFYAPLDGERTWGSTVSYAESHDEERMAYVVANSTTTPSGIRNSTELSMRRLGCVGAMMLMAPGSHMIWQFQEFGADQTTKNDSGNDTSPKRVIWSYLNDEYHAGLKDSYAALCAIRAKNPDMFGSDVTTSVNTLYTSSTYGNIVLTKGDRELVLVVNPNTNNFARTFAVPVTFDPSRYRLMAASYGQTPSLNASKQTSLRGCSFAVFGTDNLAAADDIAADLIDSNLPAEYYNMQGVRVDASSLTPGIYIVRQGSNVAKMLVR